MRCKATTLLNKKCKCKSLYYNFCHVHFKKYCSKFIINIQSTWRSYLTRKRIKNLFIDLPNELQKLVIYFMEEDYRISQFHRSCINIYNNKICKMNKYLSESYYYYQNFFYDFEEYLELKKTITDKIKYYKNRINEIT